MHGTLPALPAAPTPRGLGLPLPLRLALREMRAGLRGFTVFIACIALGVAAISGVNSIARSLVEGIAAQGRTILGGDLSLSLIQRDATPAELSELARRGRVSTLATLRAMAVAGDAGAALVEAKAVDAAYPADGAVRTDPTAPLADLLAERDGVFGAVADPALFDRLGLAPGARITVGSAPFELRARLLSEPDKIAAGIGFGPRLILSDAGLRATGLIQPGSLVRWTYRLVLPLGRDDDAAVARTAEELRRALPDAGFELRTRGNADPRFSRNIERFSQFLTLVGLTALIVGGVGVANAVAAFIDRKRVPIGILKSLGATGGRVVSIYLLQVLMITGLGVAIGVAIGAVLPFVVAGAFSARLPIPIEPILSPADLGLACLYGFLTALSFSLLPLARAQDVPVSGLFRDRVAEDPRRARLIYYGATALCGLALVAVAVGAAYDRRVAAIFIGAAAAVFLLLRLVAIAIMAGARRLPHARRPFIRLAIANLHRPGALTPSLVLSLGLGITLLVTLAGIDGSLRREIGSTLPERAPNFFFVDVASREAEAFRAFLAAQAPGVGIESVPMMRGRITAVNGVAAADVKASSETAFVLDGDRGLTYSATLPEGSTLVEGSWWPAGYGGPPLVSLDAEIAKGIGLKLGDSISVNVLGRSLTATVANLRRIEWRRLGIGFFLVFSPNSFAGAPHTQLMTATLAGGRDGAAEASLLRESARAFPAVTSVRVKDALEAVDAVVSQLVFAIRIASSVALAASLLVLAGALAAGQRARLYDAVVLKTLGATRPRLLGAYLLEYGALGLATALFGLAAGSLAAYSVVTWVMRLAYSPSLPAAAGSALLAVAVAVGLGLLGTWRVLGQKPAPYLRTL